MSSSQTLYERHAHMPATEHTNTIARFYIVRCTRSSQLSVQHMYNASVTLSVDETAIKNINKMNEVPHVPYVHIAILCASIS